MSNYKEFYTYDLNKVIKRVTDRSARKILIQLPDGFKAYATSIVDELRNYLGHGVELVIDANHIYGSCILNKHLSNYYDLIIHFGHEPYPYLNEVSHKVIFIDFLSNLRPSNRLINDLVKTLRSLDIRRTAVYATHQHKRALTDIANALLSNGIELLNINDLSKSIIMGCWFSDALKYLDKCDGYVVISGGLFHSLGLGLHIRGVKHLIQVDLYRDEVKVIDDIVSKYLKVRYCKIMKALDARTWCLIHGVEGQYRDNIREVLIKAANGKGIRVYEAQSHIINYDVIRNIDNSTIDAYVVTACPRLPIDDLSELEKPVLTPGEALMVLNNDISNYVFPW